MTTFQMKDLFAYLAVPGPDLLLRDYGRCAFPLLEQHLNQVPLGRALVLDFKGVSVMDTSFADEAVLELVLKLIAGEYGDRFLILGEPSPATVENLEGTIARRRVKAAILARGEGRLGIIGDVEPNMVDAWQKTKRSGTLTARQLADELGLEINAASMRLLKLHKLRLLAREEELSAAGRQHVYRFPQ